MLKSRAPYMHAVCDQEGEVVRKCGICWGVFQLGLTASSVDWIERSVPSCSRVEPRRMHVTPAAEAQDAPLQTGPGPMV